MIWVLGEACSTKEDLNFTLKEEERGDIVEGEGESRHLNKILRKTRKEGV